MYCTLNICYPEMYMLKPNPQYNNIMVFGREDLDGNLMSVEPL